MNEIYEVYFFVDYLMALLTYGVQLFKFMESGNELNEFLKSIFYLTAILIQFVGCYCLPSQMLCDNVITFIQCLILFLTRHNLQFASLAEAVCYSEWYDGHVKLARKLGIVLCIAQRKIVMKAGGIADINLAVLTDVFIICYWKLSCC